MSEDSFQAEDRAPPPLTLKAAFLIGLCAAAALVLAFVVILRRGNEIVWYLRDPAGTFEFSPLAGAISNFGVFCLVSAGVICLFAARIARFDRALLTQAGGFTLLIAADDFLMLHERLLPRAGIPKIVILGFYALLALVILVLHRKSLIGRRHVGLYIATGFLASSILVDQIVPQTDTSVVVEDSLKFVGLVVWAAYWIGRSHHAVLRP